MARGAEAGYIKPILKGKGKEDMLSHFYTITQSVQGSISFPMFAGCPMAEGGRGSLHIPLETGMSPKERTTVFPKVTRPSITCLYSRTPWVRRSFAWRTSAEEWEKNQNPLVSYQQSQSFLSHSTKQLSHGSTRFSISMPPAPRSRDQSPGTPSHSIPEPQHFLRRM